MEDADGQNTITPAVRNSSFSHDHPPHIHHDCTTVQLPLQTTTNHLPFHSSSPKSPKQQQQQQQQQTSTPPTKEKDPKCSSPIPPPPHLPPPKLLSEKAKQHPSHPPSPPSATKTVDAMLPIKKNIGLRMTKIKMINWILLIIFFCCCWMGNCIWRPSRSRRWCWMWGRGRGCG